MGAWLISSSIILKNGLLCNQRLGETSTYLMGRYLLPFRWMGHTETMASNHLWTVELFAVMRHSQDQTMQITCAWLTGTYLIAFLRWDVQRCLSVEWQQQQQISCFIMVLDSLPLLPLFWMKFWRARLPDSKGASKQKGFALLFLNVSGV